MGNCLITVRQPEELWQDRGEPITLPCNITLNCTGWASSAHKVLWFVFDESSHRQLRGPSDKYRPGQDGLTFYSLQTNDSGVYYCAAVLDSTLEGAQKIGQGTTLVVRGKAQKIGQLQGTK